jgi:hypothetical protein
MGRTFRSGIAAVDRYLAKGYDEVGRLSEMGVHGSLAEIGTFEGRSFIAMGLALADGEHAYGRTSLSAEERHKNPGPGRSTTLRAKCERPWAFRPRARTGGSA